MKALLSALALSAAMPALANAGPFDDLADYPLFEDMELLTFTHEFSQTSDLDFPAFSGHPSERHRFGTGLYWWEVPEFDYSLGTPEYLYLNLNGFLDVDIIIDGQEDNPVQGLRPLRMLSPNGSVLFFVQEGQLDFVDLGYFDAQGNRSSIAIGLYGGDTFVVWPNELAGSVHVEWSGVATAGYFYTPFETTAVPEPSSLVLLGTGVTAAYHSRRRKERST